MGGGQIIIGEGGVGGSTHAGCLDLGNQFIEETSDL